MNNLLCNFFKALIWLTVLFFGFISAYSLYLNSIVFLPAFLCFIALLAMACTLDDDQQFF